MMDRISNCEALDKRNEIDLFWVVDLVVIGGWSKRSWSKRGEEAETVAKSGRFYCAFVASSSNADAVDSNDVRCLKHIVSRASTFKDNHPITKEDPKRLVRVFCRNNQKDSRDKIRKRSDQSKFFDVCYRNRSFSTEEGSDQDSLSAIFNPKEK
ncbi:hypothetical protein TNCT_164011 [Trichonephila clavata]|uniref:Uncharacterized protein n=1 Tax=Trichonephila clavata TaxID=2740835 RepID=A0A8X6FAZ1_TRICU|nr:hypothetical protein TNCT_164011 [Trichonephila clavata]